MAQFNAATGPNNNGLGFLGVLTLIFVVSKIVGLLEWSWFWVFSPMIFGCAAVMALAVLVEVLKEFKK